MGVSFVIVKCFLFAFNLFCLALGLAAISVNAYGLENARPGTEEHTYFVVGIITSSLVCMTTLVGCYGVVCELLGMNIVYAIFIIMLLAVQYLQMQTLEANTFYLSAVQRLEVAWRQVESRPHIMQALETNFHCCALYNVRDYRYMDLSTPNSCYRLGEAAEPINLHTDGCLLALKNFYQSAVERDHIFNWALVIAECLACINSIILSSLLYRQDRLERPRGRLSHDAVRVQVGPLCNHVGSRTHLLSD